MKTIKSIAAISIISLAACGGGGSSKVPPIEGAFLGKYTNGVSLIQLVRGDGMFWSVYGSADRDVAGFSTGQVKSDDGRFTVTFTDFPAPGDQPIAGTGSGVYTPTSITGTTTEQGETSNFKLSVIPEKNYKYRTPASLSAIVGTWSGEFLDGEDGDIEVLADGIFSGVTEDGCEFNGKFKPDADVNVFDVDVQFGGTPCVLVNQSAAGLAWTILGNDGKNRLSVAAVAGTTPSTSVGSVFVAKR